MELPLIVEPARLAESLGYPRIKGYTGARSEWGNLADTPVEV